MTHRKADQQQTRTPEVPRCESCGGVEELILYQDAAGCGTATIELWRCTDCGHARYGDIMGYGTCDVDL